MKSLRLLLLIMSITVIFQINADKSYANELKEDVIDSVLGTTAGAVSGTLRPLYKSAQTLAMALHQVGKAAHEINEDIAKTVTTLGENKNDMTFQSAFILGTLYASTLILMQLADAALLGQKGKAYSLILPGYFAGSAIAGAVSGGLKKIGFLDKQ